MKLKLFFFLLILISIDRSFSQDSNSLETIIVEDSVLESPLNYPSSFSTTINLENFEGEFNATSELLSMSPGVTVRDFGGFGQLKTVSIRGSSNDQVVILLDGIRINNPLGGGVDLSTIPNNYIDRIEIIRGGSSALVGSDAIGGIINIITKEAGDPFTDAFFTYGSFNTLSLGVSRSGNFRDLNYLISFNHTQSDGDFEFNSVNDLTLKRINNDFKSYSLFAKLNYEFNEWRVDFLNEFFYDDKGVPGLGEFQQENARQEDLRNFTTLKFSKDSFIRDNIDFNFLLYNRFDKLKFENPTPTVGIPIDTNSKLNSFGFIPGINLYHGNFYILNSFFEFRQDILNNDDFDNPKRSSFSLFFGNEFITLGDKILINALARLDLINTDGTTDSTDFGVSPKVGILYNLKKNFYLKSNLSRSFRVPSFSELFFPEQGFIGGNPDLDNEVAIDFDFGFSYVSPKISFEINYFLSHVDDLILFVFVSAQRIEPRNVGETIQQGIESSFFFRPYEFFDLIASYTFLDSELEDTGAQLPGRPRNQFDLRAVLKHRNLKIFWETHFVDEIPLSVFRNSRTTDARTTHDLGGKITWKNYFLTIEGKNIFNNLNVRDALDFPLPGRTIFFTIGINT